MADINAMTATDLAYLIPEKWDKKVLHDAEFKDFWGKFKGPEGSQKPIVEKQDFTKEAGDKLHIQTLSELEGAGVTGSTALRATEEKYSIGQFDVTIDVLRHAVAFKASANKMALMNLITVAGGKLSRWMGRKLSDDVFNSILGVSGPTTIYAGGATSADTIDSGCAFTPDDIDILKLTLQRQGAIPLLVKRNSGAEEEYYGAAMSEIDAYNLRGSSDWLQAQREAGIRGEKNPIFSSALGIWNGVLLYVHTGQEGLKGTPLRPETKLFEAEAAGSTTLKLVVTSDDNKDYSRYFQPTGSGSFYVKIDDEVITCSAKDNCSFTCTATGSDHAEGALVTSAGALSTLSTVIGFGAEMVARAWGQHPTRITDDQDYQEDLGIGVKAVYGQAAIKNSGGSYPNLVILNTYGKKPS